MEKFNELFKQIKAQIDQIKLEKSYEVYSNTEFMLLDLTIVYWEYKQAYEESKIEMDRIMTDRFNQIRKDFKSDTATNKAIDEEYKEEIDILSKMKAETQSMKTRLDWVIRILSHLESYFIREQSEIKRQEFVESLQNKIS